MPLTPWALIQATELLKHKFMHPCSLQAKLSETTVLPQIGGTQQDPHTLPLHGRLPSSQPAAELLSRKTWRNELREAWWKSAQTVK